jgi:hypothetical protein
MVLVPIPGSDLTTTAALFILKFVKNVEIDKEAAVVEGRAYRLVGRLGRLSDRNCRAI